MMRYENTTPEEERRVEDYSFHRRIHYFHRRDCQSLPAIVIAVEVQAPIHSTGAAKASVAVWVAAYPLRPWTFVP